MKYLNLIAALLALIVPEARAGWDFLDGTEHMDRIYTLESDGNRLYTGTRNGVYISTDDGHTWHLTGLTHGVGIIAIGDGAVYAFAYKHGIFRSDDYGETWNLKNNGLHRIDDRTGAIRLPFFHQILVTSSGMVIAVGYHDGTYISRDRGETWHYPLEEWVFDSPFLSTYIALDTWSLTEFDGYLWSACWVTFHPLFRTFDEGGTWESLPNWAAPRRALSDYGQVQDWAVLNGRLYVAAEKGFARWDEGELAWDDINNGQPDLPNLRSLAVYRGRIFAGVRDRGVCMFDERSQTWFPVGMNDRSIGTLESHQSYLYAVTYPDGIYRASIPVVRPTGKLVTTWGAIKQK